MSSLPRNTLLSGPIAGTLLRLAAPMVIGIASIVLFQVVDTFFVGQLGVTPLAAMSYTFPITFIVLSVGMGLSIGATAVIARAIGQGNQTLVRRLTTHSLLLAAVVVTVLASLGLLTLRPLFTLMGAGADTIPLIVEYMLPWYMAVGFLIIPMVGNGAIRASGDTKTPMYIMLVAGLVNLALDPLLIFGLGPFPRMELRGAAYATAISWVLTFVFGLWILHYREHMLELERPRLKEVLSSWQRVIRIGLPAAATNLLLPLALLIITRFASNFGEDAVAALGVGTRVEGLALVGANALSTATTPFIGQNFGAGNHERIRGAFGFLVKAALIWGAGVALPLFVFADEFASWFNDSPAVVTLAAEFLRIVPASYGALGVGVIIGTFFNALNEPARSALVMVVRLFALAVPLSYVGMRLYGMPGIFAGLSVGNFAIGVIAFTLASASLARVRRRTSMQPAAPSS